MPAFTQACARGGNSGGPGPDTLDIIAGLDNCAPLAVCKSTGGATATLELPSGPPNGSICPTFPGMAAVAPGPNNELFVIGRVTKVAANTCDPATAPPLHPGLQGYPGGSPNSLGIQVTMPTAQGPPEWHPGGGSAPSGTNLQLLFPVEVVHYQIFPDNNDPADPGVPCLWRSVTGGLDAATGFASPETIPGPGWQMVARGIENLQVRYSSGIPVAGVPPTTTDEPPVVVAGNYNTLVYQVQVTLSARVTAQNLQGETIAPGLGGQRVRGELTTQISPREALIAYAVGGQYR